MEANFKRRISLLLLETVFLASNSWLYFPSDREITNSLSSLLETDFVSTGSSILLFRALLKFWKFGGGNFFKGNLISVRGN